MMEVVSGDNWRYKTCKAPVKMSPPTNQHPVFLQDGCPSCCPTDSVKARVIKSNESFTEQKSGLYLYNSRSHFRRAEQVGQCVSEVEIQRRHWSCCCEQVVGARLADVARRSADDGRLVSSTADIQ